MKTLLSRGVKVENHGNGFVKKDVIGKNNFVYVGKNTMVDKTRIRIRGDNNKILIGEGCKIRKKCSFWIQGDGCSIIIGNNVTMQHANHFNCSENNRKITVGDDCMISNNLIVRTSDGHGIFDMETKKRLNMARDVNIGKHVWIAPNSRIMKGVTIDDGAIVGSNTLVTKNIPSNCLAVGMPARIVKENIFWNSSIKLAEE